MSSDGNHASDIMVIKKERPSTPNCNLHLPTTIRVQDWNFSTDVKPASSAYVDRCCTIRDNTIGDTLLLYRICHKTKGNLVDVLKEWRVFDETKETI